MKAKGKFTGGGYVPPKLGPVPAEAPAPISAEAAQDEQPKAIKPAPKAKAEKGSPVHSERLAILVKPEDFRGFKVLQAQTGQKGPELMAEALDLLFAKYGHKKA